MFLRKMTLDGPDTGQCYMMAVESKVAIRRVGAGSCDDHGTRAEAIEQFLQYQLDRDIDLWFSRRVERACEIYGEPTILPARLGRNTELFVLCQRYQFTTTLPKLARSSIVSLSVDEA